MNWIGIILKGKVLLIMFLEGRYYGRFCRIFHIISQFVILKKMYLLVIRESVGANVYRIFK